MTPHRNTGARFRREDGTVWESGGVHVPTPDELLRRRYKLEPVAAIDAPERAFVVTPVEPVKAPDEPENVEPEGADDGEG